MEFYWVDGSRIIGGGGIRKHVNLFPTEKEVRGVCRLRGYIFNVSLKIDDRSVVSPTHHKVHGGLYSLRHALPDFRGRPGFA